MVRGMTLFICTKCKKVYLAPDVEYAATVYSTPMPCKRCGSIRTMPLLMPHYWIYKKIWESMERNKLCFDAIYRFRRKGDLGQITE